MTFEGCKEFKIGELTTWKSGGTPSKSNQSFWNGHIPWLSAKTFNKIEVHDSEIKITEKGLLNGSRLAEVDSILLLVRGSGLFNRLPVGIVTKAVAFNQDIKAIEVAKEKLRPRYFLYWLEGNKDLLNSKLEFTGIGAGKFDINVLKELSIYLPSLEKQDKVIDVIKSIDEKIELNRQTNQTLEAIAHAIFKEWFVDFNFPGATSEMQDSEIGKIPKGWRIGKLSDILDIEMGQSPPGSSYNQNKEGLVFFQGKAEFGFRFPKIDKYTTDSKRYANRFDTLLSVRAPVGVVNMAKVKCCIGRGLASLRGKNNEISYTYYLLKSLHSEFDTYEGTGTVFGSINKSQLENLRIVIPPSNDLMNFENKVNALDEFILNNDEEIETLIETRDLLLPKLMKGEITIKDSEKIAATVL